jgi:glycosyltransferase involved in cell wall biosynthesis
MHKPSSRRISSIARSVLPRLGSGTHGQRIDQTIKCLDLEKTCSRTGFIPHIERLLAACDLLVFPAITNHFARPIVEAGAMGKPVVASRFPIMEELVKDGETGLLVPPSEPAALAEAIGALLKDPQKRIEMGNRAHAIARLKYDRTRNTQAIMEVYDDLLTEHRPPSTNRVAMRAPSES